MRPPADQLTSHINSQRGTWLRLMWPCRKKLQGRDGMPERGRPTAARRTLLVCSLAVAGLIGAAAPTAAQTYPSRAITLVVGLAPGSGQDTTARTISKRASALLGVQIVIENKPGAGTMAASLAVAKAPPDGYTLLQNGPALSVNPSLYKHVPYDAAKDVLRSRSWSICR